MIGWLNGQIIDMQQPGKLVLDVNGVGYDVETSLPTFFQLEEPRPSVGLHIHTIVREDALLLYGFLDKQERALFRALIKVSGVGPKMAMAILSSITPTEFMLCIQRNDALRLTKLPGIGKKTAERLLIEMRDSVDRLSTVVESRPFAFQPNEAISALEALGYKSQESMQTINKINDGNKTTEQLIREALKILCPG